MKLLVVASKAAFEVRIYDLARVSRIEAAVRQVWRMSTPESGRGYKSRKKTSFHFKDQTPDYGLGFHFQKKQDNQRQILGLALSFEELKLFMVLALKSRSYRGHSTTS